MWSSARGGSDGEMAVRKSGGIGELGAGKKQKRAVSPEGMQPELACSIRDHDDDDDDNNDSKFSPGADVVTRESKSEQHNRAMASTRSTAADNIQKTVIAYKLADGTKATGQTTSR